MKLSIVIVNYNGAEYICESVRRAIMTGAEVIVVDNGSNDKSGELIREKFIENIKFIRLGKNYGLSYGYNRGFEKTRGEVVAFLNGDVYVGKSFRNILKEFKNFEVGVVQPKILDGTGKFIDNMGGWIDLLGYAHLWERGRDEGRTTERREVFYASGACFAVRREVFERVKGFDESFFMHYEDVDFSWRVRLAGFKIMCSSFIAVRHLGGSAVCQQKLDVRRRLIRRNRLVTLLKNYGFIQKLIFIPLLIGSYGIIYFWEKIYDYFFCEPYHFLGTLESQDYFLNPIKNASKHGYKSLTFTPYTKIMVGSGIRQGYIFIHSLNKKILVLLLLFALLPTGRWKVAWMPHTSFGKGDPFALPFNVIKLIVRFIKRLDLVLCISKYELDYYRNLGIKKCVFSPLFIEKKLFANIKRKKGVNAILFMGGGRQVKNLETVLSAFRLVRKEFSKIKLIVLGKVEKSIPEKGVEYWGEVEPGSKKFIMAFEKSLIFVNSSFYEGQSLAMMEAVEAGMTLFLPKIPSVMSGYKGWALFHEPEDEGGLARNIISFLRGRT